MAAQPAFSILASGATDVGRRREQNEDAHLVDRSLGLFIVADGMGGHAGGGTASRLAVETIQASVRAAQSSRPEAFGATEGVEDSPLPEVLRQAVEDACARIFQTAQEDPELAGMGTTVTAALVNGRLAFVAHVGDSRCYLLREGRIYQVSEDHSLVNEQLKAGTISADEAKRSRFKNIITRSVGFEQQVQVDLMGVELRGWGRAGPLLRRALEPGRGPGDPPDRRREPDSTRRPTAWSSSPTCGAATTTSPSS